MARKKRAPIAAGILWEGFSPVDGAPIVAIATDRSKNAKTGDMIQIWILRSDVAPHLAIKDGRDSSVCGSCPMRAPAALIARGEGNKGRGCYVLTHNAPRSVYTTFRAGKYRPLPVSALAGRRVRLGAYGDPAMLPVSLVREICSVASMHTGYTHQWHTAHGKAFAGLVMASVETLAGEKKARALGFGIFRAGLKDGSDKGAATLCAAERSGATCAACGACDGRKVTIYIPSHGPGANFVPAARLLARKAA